MHKFFCSGFCHFCYSTLTNSFREFSLITLTAMERELLNDPRLPEFVVVLLSSRDRHAK